MRIWILNHYATPTNGMAGTRHAVLTRHLAASGRDVTIFAAAANPGNGDEKDYLFAQTNIPYIEQIIEGVRWRFIRTTPFNNAFQRLQNMHSFRYNVLRSTVGLLRPDIIIGSCVHLHAVDAARQLSRRYQVPFVFEVRDIWPESLVDFQIISRTHPVYWYLRTLERRAIRAADGAIGVHPGMPSYLEQHGIHPKRICHIPNGVDPMLYQNVGDPPDDGPFVIAYWGAHGPANGLEHIVEAAALLQQSGHGKNIRIRLVGDGTRKCALQRRAVEHSLQNIEFLPRVPKTQLASFGEQSHAFILCLRHANVLQKYGTSSNKLYDYMMAARPVIFCASSHNRPVDEARAGITIPPDNPRLIAEAMVRISKTPRVDRLEMGSNARQYVLRHHNLTDLAGQMDAFLCNIAAAKGARRAA